MIASVICLICSACTFLGKKKVDFFAFFAIFFNFQGVCTGELTPIEKSKKNILGRFTPAVTF